MAPSTGQCVADYDFVALRSLRWQIVVKQDEFLCHTYVNNDIIRGNIEPYEVNYNYYMFNFVGICRMSSLILLGIIRSHSQVTRWSLAGHSLAIGHLPASSVMSFL